MAKLVEFIYAESKTGKGTAEDPVRMVKQLWTKDGALVAEYDVFHSAGYWEPHRTPEPDAPEEI